MGMHGIDPSVTFFFFSFVWRCQTAFNRVGANRAERFRGYKVTGFMVSSLRVHGFGVFGDFDCGARNSESPNTTAVRGHSLTRPNGVPRTEYGILCSGRWIATGNGVIGNLPSTAGPRDEHQSLYF